MSQRFLRNGRIRDSAPKLNRFIGIVPGIEMLSAVHLREPVKLMLPGSTNRRHQISSEVGSPQSSASDGCSRVSKQVIENGGTVDSARTLKQIIEIATGIEHAATIGVFASICSMPKTKLVKVMRWGSTNRGDFVQNSLLAKLGQERVFA